MNFRLDQRKDMVRFRLSALLMLPKSSVYVSAGKGAALGSLPWLAVSVCIRAYWEYMLCLSPD